MSTPSTITSVHPSHHLYPSPRYPEHLPPSSEIYRSLPSLSRLTHNNYSTNKLNRSAADLPTATSLNGTKDLRISSKHDYSAQPPPLLENMKASHPHERRTNWNDFYKNGLPKEIIVIDDDSPDPPPRQSPRTQLQRNPRITSGHVDKKRRTEARVPYDPVDQQSHAGPYNDSSSNSTHSAGRTTSALYSTAPTSLESSTGSGDLNKSIQEEPQAGQKRKRAAHRASNDVPGHEITGHGDAYQSYRPPPKPPIKAHDVYVHVHREKAHVGAEKCDDEDGHYTVVANSDLADRYTITRLLGQGTFGKVVEAFDKRTQTKCAVKIIRAVPKYRDASRIELRVLATLASNDKHNRNKCIHLRDCFDYRNHICIVTDLLGQSVFDFLKANAFTPFPSSHIQSFARQLFTSVAFLHDLNLIHTDLKPENILLVHNSYQTFTYNRNIPSATKANPRTAKHRRVLLNPEIRLIDFGSATFDDEYHSTVVSTRHYRAPEIILNLGWSFPCDIWSIGCILVEFYTGDALFQTHDNLEHLAMMEAVCNIKFDQEIARQVRSGKGNGKNSASAYFKPRALSLNYPSDDTPKTSRKYVKNMKTLSETIPPTTRFNEKFLDLLRRIFVYDPRKRITAQQALKHPWFMETLQDDGTEAHKIRLKQEAEHARRTGWR